jgi:hypothetical protein
MYHYVYRISNTSDNMHYYGKRSSKIHPKEDLGIKYFSSSKDVTFLEDQKLNPQNYEYIIVAYCSTSKEALELEIYLHSYYKVGCNSRFYNKAAQTSVGFSTEGVKYSEERKAKMSLINKGKKLSEEHKNKIRKASIGNKRNLGKKHSDKTRHKLSEAGKGLNNVNAKVINIYDYTTNELLAKNVVASVWCKENNHVAYCLRATLKRDLTLPHCAVTKFKNKYNPHHYKNMYAVLASQ